MVRVQNRVRSLGVRTFTHPGSGFDAMHPQYSFSTVRL
uniref:Uncharacterized protein n=1 Tax=Siphoviridae sp. ctrpM6 TaxID=2827956 RepID=A0A8S5T3V3_9CAUD|nr:MAG TPA: hypothetical protein [Siphoviridae sp. ctrpM6]